VQGGARAAAKEVGPLLEPEPDLVEGRLPVPDGDDEPVADEEEDLAELDLAALPAGRLEHEEERVAVELELRPLVRLDRVLDGQLVQVELAPDRVELARARLVEPDPDECVGPERLVGVLQGKLAGPAPPLLVHGAVDDHGPSIARHAARAIMRVACASIAGSGRSPSSP
jgi:hypothetical protein